MRTLNELIDENDPGINLLNQWMSQAVRPVELLPPSQNAGLVLSQLQVTTRSMLGTLAYETGGVIVDHGWLRFLGSGNERLTRNIADWNLDRTDGLFLVADDAVGGFYAIQGAAGREVSYRPPDTLKWQPLGVGLSGLLQWACLGNLDTFYTRLRWPGWPEEIAALHADKMIVSHPPVWSKNDDQPLAIRKQIPVEEVWKTQSNP